MNIDECICFLGHASVHPIFDSFLLNNKIKKRPKGKESYETLDTSDHNVVLCFQLLDDFEEESLIPVKSRGISILSEIEVHSDNSGRLPYNLSFKDSLKDVKSKLGCVIDDFDRTLPEKRILTFYHDLVVIGIFVNNIEEIFMIKFSIPTVYDRKNLNIDA